MSIRERAMRMQEDDEKGQRRGMDGAVNWGDDEGVYKLRSGLGLERGPARSCSCGSTNNAWCSVAELFALDALL